MWLLLAVSVLWALSFGLITRVSALGAPFVAAVRTVLAAAVFLPFVRARGMGARQALGLAAIGALQFGIMYVLYFQSYRWLHASEVALFTIFTPLFVTFADGALARRLSWIFLATATLAVAGTGICLWTSLDRPGILLGFLLMQLSNACFALGQVLYRRAAPRTGRTDRELMGVLYAGAAVVALATALPGTRWDKVVQMTPGQAGILVYLGVVASGLGFFMFNAGARRTDVGTLAVLNNAKVPLAILASALVFGEKVDWGRTLAGGLVIAGALALNGWLARARPGVQME
jgi:drug/metabolite transporter (DMT)-like permease